jgi:hypothetical protein
MYSILQSADVSRSFFLPLELMEDCGRSVAKSDSDPAIKHRAEHVRDDFEAFLCLPGGLPKCLDDPASGIDVPLSRKNPIGDTALMSQK